MCFTVYREIIGPCFFLLLFPSLSASEFKTWRIPMSQTISLYTQLRTGEIKTERNQLQVKNCKINRGENALHSVYFSYKTHLWSLSEEMCPPVLDHFPSRGQCHLSNGGLWVSEFQLLLLKPDIWTLCRPGGMPMQPYLLFLN